MYTFLLTNLKKSLQYTSMNKSPNKSSHQKESPSGSGFRTVIFLLLTSIAASGVGGYILGKSSESKANKPDIIDARKVSGEGGDARPKQIPKGWIPAAGAEELINLAQCRLLVLKLDPSVISETEILKMADKIKNGDKKIDADGIIAKFCIHDSSDKKKIRDLVAKGFKIKKVEKSHDGSWEMIFTNSLFGDDEEEKYLDLNERHVCKLLTPDEESGLEKSRKQNQAKKELIENLKKGNVDETLKQFDTRKIMEEAKYQGIDNEEIIKELVKGIDKLKSSIKSTQNEMDKKKMICELLPSLLKLGVLTDKLGEHAKAKIEDNPNIPIDKFGNFLEALAESLGIDDFESCILYQAGITPEELMESSKQ